MALRGPGRVRTRAQPTVPAQRDEQRAQERLRGSIARVLRKTSAGQLPAELQADPGARRVCERIDLRQGEASAGFWKRSSADANSLTH